MMMIKYFLISITLLFISAVSIADDKAIIVFDASGSMWGQVEGKNKISIAKKTLINLVDNWDDSAELGLLAYGHRRKGDCKDIQTLVPVGKINKSQMISSVKNINPKGKTPISASIRMAADELKFTEDKATVILISDGKETCNADPCKTAADLEKLGINFTAHVIGFDVDKETSKQLKCIADNTGGKYFSADNAKELTEALEKVVQQARVLTIQAINKENGETLDQLIEWKLINEDTEEVISVSASGKGKELIITETGTKEPRKNAIATGKWLISGTSGMYAGETNIEITGDDNQLIKIDMVEQLPKVTLTAPDEATTGTEILISWDAPDVEKARITLQEATEKPQYHSNPSLYTEAYKNTKEATMRLPSHEGDYLLRFYSTKDTKTILGTHKVTLKPAEIVITAPEEAITGTELELSWTAPKKSKARIVLQLADEKPQYHTNPSLYTKKKNQATMRLPSESGNYVLRWFNTSDSKLMVERPIKLIEAEISIDAPNEAGAGTEIDVSWEAPKNSDARITLEMGGEKPNYHSTPSLYTTGNNKILRLPSIAGNYLLRWYNSSDKKLITERPIKITEQTITITAKDEATAGTETELLWDAPKGLDSFINIQLADEKPNYNARPYLYTKKKISGYLRLPSIAGEYILRWYNKGDRKNIITEHPITLTVPKIEIEAPEEAEAGTELALSWTAPKDLDSFINIQLSDEKPNYSAKYYVYTKKKSSDYLRLPSKAGDYILRWFNRNDREMLIEHPIKLVSPNIVITAPEEVVAGSEVEISWTAPKGLDSFINIQKDGEKPNYSAKNYLYTNRNSSGYIKIPEVPGDYVLRWYNRHDRTMMVEKKIKIISKE
jgi:hypothetical protein